MQSLNGFVIVHTYERVVRSKSRDSGLYSDFVIERENCYSGPMHSAEVRTYLEKRAKSLDSIIDVKIYELSEVDIDLSQVYSV